MCINHTSRMINAYYSYASLYFKNTDHTPSDHLILKVLQDS